MVKKRLLKNFNVSNKLSYTIIAVVALLLVGSGVYSLSPGVAPNPGHTFDQIDPPSGCTLGQVLQWTGSAWSCVSLTASCFVPYTNQADDDVDGYVEQGFNPSVVSNDCNDEDARIHPNSNYVRSSSLDINCDGTSEQLFDYTVGELGYMCWCGFYNEITVTDFNSGTLMGLQLGCYQTNFDPQYSNCVDLCESESMPNAAAKPGGCESEGSWYR